MIILTFPSIEPGEKVIRAQGDGIDETVGYCRRTGEGWTAVLYAMAGRAGIKAGKIDRPTMVELRDAVNGRLVRSGKWWR